MIRAALAYARAGFPIFPCNPTSDKAAGSKAPLVPGESKKGARDGGHWLATTDLVQIERWWRRWPEALIGFPTGARSGAVVVDLDPKDCAVDTMAAALATWCGGGFAWRDPETGEFIAPAFSRTQSGGAHLWFALPQGGEILNRTNLFSGFLKTREAHPDLAHIDVRGDGGYVIAPPSVMQNGNAYTWITRPARNDAGGWLLPPLPPALRRVITRERLPSDQAPRSAPSRPTRFSTDAAVQNYVNKTVDGILSALSRAGAGERNQLIFWASCRMGELVLGGVLSRGEAENLILGNLPSGVSPAEPKARKTIANGFTDSKLVPFDARVVRSGGRG